MTGRFAKLTEPAETADYYVEVGFTGGAGDLEPGKYIETHTRIGKDDWSVFKPGNDYSQNLANEFTYFDQVDMFYKGKLVWGKGSMGSGTDPVTPTEPAVTATPEPQATPTPPQTTPTPEPKDYKLTLQMYNTGNSGKTANTIHPMIRLLNTGNQMVKYSDITIRYYYTADDNKPQNFWCDWSDAGQNNITGAFHKLTEKYEGADTYLELGFKEGSGYLGIGASTDLHIRFAKNDWTDYNLTNDYSLRAGESFADWDQVDVFIKGEKVWGKGVLPAEEEEEEEHIDYADTTYTPVRGEMYNTAKEKRSNNLSPRFRIYNTSDENIRLTDLHINYFYTTDGAEDQIFEADWAGIGGMFQTSIGRNNITADFTEVGDSNLATNCVADIGFTGTDEILKPGDYLELHTRIHRPNWTNYVQTNDYSFNTDSTDYEEWNKIAVFVGGKWAFGSLPLTYAGMVDPDPEDDYPVDTKGPFGSDTDKDGNTTYYSYDDSGNITAQVDALGNKTEYTYNKFNQITSITDALGNKTVYGYDGKGNLTSYTDALGNKTEYTYNSFGAITKVTLSDGSFETRNYDSRGNLTSVTDAEGNTVAYTYDSFNHITRAKDAMGNVNSAGSTESYEYLKDGSLTKITDAYGNTTLAAYNKDGKLTKETDKNGNAAKYAYSTATGLLSQVTDALSAVEKYEYDSMGNVTSVTAADGGKTTYDYDLFGRKTAETDPLGGKTTYTYDKNGNLTWEKDALGDITKYTYDKVNRLSSCTDALGNTSSYEYDALGRTTKEVDALGGATAYAYDKNGRLTETTDALGNTVKQKYNNLGLLTASIDGEGNRTAYTYDKTGNQLTETDGEGNTQTHVYDKNGNLIKETDALGHGTTYTYDKLNRLTAEKDALGNTTGYQYDANGNRTVETDALGNATKYTFDALNQLTKVTDAAGGITKYTYNKMGQQTKVTDAMGNSTSYQYDKNGKVLAVTNPLGKKEKYQYNLLGLLENYTDVRGNKTTYEYDKNGRIVKETDAQGNINLCNYDKNGNLILKTDALGNKTTSTYDALNQLVSYKDPDGNITAYKYDTRGNVTKETDALGNNVLYEYNGENQLIKTTNAVGGVYQYEYDAAGQRTKKTDSKGYSITYKYDKVGNMVSYTDALNNTTSNSYNTAGLLKTTTDPEGNITKFEYDVLGQRAKIIDPRGYATQYGYDKNGNLTSEKDAAGNTISYTYDKEGRLLDTVDQNKHINSYQYDASGNITAKTDEDGNQTKYVFDSLDQLTKVTDALGHTVKYVYDKTGNVTEQTRAGSSSSRNQTIKYQYDANGNLIAQTDPLGQTKKYSYSKTGQLLSETEKDGTVTSYSYDSQGINTGIKYGEGKTVHFTYDSRSLLTKMTDWNGTSSFEYDANSQVIKATNYKGTSIHYTWTKNGEKKSLVYPDGSKVVYEYDGAGNLTKVKDTSSGITAYSYDELNQVTKKLLPNGGETLYSYDNTGLLTDRVEKNGEAEQETYRYEYSKNGNRKQETKVKGGTKEDTSYQYDALNQLLQVNAAKGTRKYTYDEFGNRATKEETGKEDISYTYNKQNELLQEKQGGVIKAYSYDKNGNQIELKKNGVLQERFTYDTTNHLSQAENIGQNKSTEYSYDGFGNRVSSKVMKGSTVESHLNYTVDQETPFKDIIAVNDNVTAKTSSFTYGNSLLSIDTKGNIKYYRTDDKGSISMLQDSSGEILKSFDYDEFGNQKNNSKGINDNTVAEDLFSYTGHIYEESTGLYYAKSRYYNPQTGRFISEDTYQGRAENPGSLNLYIYVQNNPIIHVDPTGHDLWKLSTILRYTKGSYTYDARRGHVNVSANKKYRVYNIEELAVYKGEIIIDDRQFAHDFNYKERPFEFLKKKLKLKSKNNDIRTLNSNRLTVSQVRSKAGYNQYNPAIQNYIESLVKEYGEIGYGYALQRIGNLDKLFNKTSNSISAKVAHKYGLSENGINILKLSYRLEKKGYSLWLAGFYYNKQMEAERESLLYLSVFNPYKYGNGTGENPFYLESGGNKYYKNSGKSGWNRAKNTVKGTGKSYEGTRNLGADFKNGKRLTSHFMDHGGDFRYKTEEEYLAGARNFVKKKPTTTTQSFVSEGGTYFRYDIKTNEFAIVNQYGGISTYFKPENGLNYWIDQVNRYKPK